MDRQRERMTNKCLLEKKKIDRSARASFLTLQCGRNTQENRQEAAAAAAQTPEEPLTGPTEQAS
jgi:hypothetical protein